MTTAKKLANALSLVLAHGLTPDLHQQARTALDAYKESEEFKREQFEERLRGALATANALVETVRELRMMQGQSDADLILLRSADEHLADGADALNSVIEGTTL